MKASLNKLNNQAKSTQQQTEEWVEIKFKDLQVDTNREQKGGAQ